jgi:UDP-2,4-diacetamido-2,4,6-trideoxy-beta-L-altropyranose hydrolase
MALHNPDLLVLRCDASVAIGTGHVMRCLALAQQWHDGGGTCLFAMAEATAAAEDRIQAEGFPVLRVEATPGSRPDAEQLVEHARRHAASWVAVDGYHFDAEYQRLLKQGGIRVLLVDDNGESAHYWADLVLNQNAHARADMYSQRESCTRLLLGPRYAMLRREFERWGSWKRDIAPVGRKVLITMGGSDPQNVTARVIDALRLVNVEGLEATVVVGGSNPHFESLQSAAAGAGAIRFERNVADMSALMAWADVAVSAAGTTCWEMCMLGLPAILIDLAENQKPIARALAEQSVAVHLGDSSHVTAAAIAPQLNCLLFSSEKRAAMCRGAMEIVDGRGAERVVALMRGADFRLRRVEERDCRLLWRWANDPAVRAVSFSPEPISWDQHVQWFQSQLASPDALLYLVTDSADTPIGEVRYQLDGSRAVVSICLGPEWRGRGYSQIVLGMATNELFRSTNIAKVDAYVKGDNQVSWRLFKRFGFAVRGTERVGSELAVHFELARHQPS